MAFAGCICYAALYHGMSLDTSSLYSSLNLTIDLVSPVFYWLIVGITRGCTVLFPHEFMTIRQILLYSSKNMLIAMVSEDIPVGKKI